jgi:hypothetical protein
MYRKPAMPTPPNRKTLIAKMKETAKRLGKSLVTQAEFRRQTGINLYQVLKHFDGFNELLHAAGLTTYLQNLRVDDDELLRAMGEVFRAEKGLVTRVRFAKTGRYSLQTYANRWGCWSKALRAFRKWQPTHDPAFPYAGQLTSYRVPGRIPREGPAWAPRGGRQYGEPLHFRGMQNTPVNETGVVSLFAALAVELGFVVESLTPGFPDCEAKRRVGKVWERVRIEFEFQSRNFRDHRHDPEACDLIVCWEHNWPKCPLEVLELKQVVAGQHEIRTIGMPAPAHGGGVACRISSAPRGHA